MQNCYVYLFLILNSFFSRISGQRDIWQMKPELRYNPNSYYLRVTYRKLTVFRVLGLRITIKIIGWHAWRNFYNLMPNNLFGVILWIFQQTKNLYNYSRLTISSLVGTPCNAIYLEGRKNVFWRWYIYASRRISSHGCSHFPSISSE